MFKKPLKEVCSGRHTVPSNLAKFSYFSKREWQSWLSYVSNFYRGSGNTDSNGQIAPLFVKQGSDNRPYICVKLFDRDIVALLDSGATASIVGSGGFDMLKQLELNINPSSTPSVSVANGNQQAVTGLVDLPVCVGDVCQIVKALVVPSLPQSFIFGSDFAKQFQIMIDFKGDHWYVQSTLSHANIELARDSESIERVYNLMTLADLTMHQRKKAEEVMKSFEEISSETTLGRTNKITLTIDTGDAKPFKKKQYLMSPYMTKILNSELDDMLKLGVVEPSHSPWSSPVLLVKKSSGEYRFCFDGRPLNEVTKHDSYPLPHIDRILNLLRDAKYISSIDLRKAFWQIPLDEASKEKTAFSVVGRGLFHFTVMPFGLCNASQTQQRLVDAIFGPKYEPKIFAYLDDVIITSSTFEEHVQLLSEVIELLKEANLTINLKKCEFFKTSLKFLGFVVGSNGLSTDPEKVSSIVNYPRPTNVTEVKRFLGLCSWYRRFISNFSTLVAPLSDLTKGKKKKQPISWSSEAEASFLKIKEALVSAPILSQPDFSKPFTIQSDASDTGLGGILTQFLDGEERVIAYASRSLSRAERNYSVTQRECLGVLFCTEKFRPYIEGTRFTVITDHHSLLWLNNLKNPTGKLARWAVRLRQHTFDLVHRKGSSNVVPDALSRIPSAEAEVLLLEISLQNLDDFYLSMRENISSSPELYPQWKLLNGFVYKLVPSRVSVQTNLTEWKLLVPKNQRQQVIGSCHDPAVCAHFGFFKTFARVQEHYYWPKMRQDVMKYVRKCQVCASQKIANSPRMGLMGAEKSASYPWQIISVDIMGPFPRSSKGNTHLLVVGDWFTKYTLVCPMRKATAQNVVKFMENEVFLVFGVPQFILCDNGTQFAGSIFKKLAKQYQVQKIWFSARYAPQCNFVERNNKTVGTAIRCYIKEHKDWDKEIHKIRQAINTAKHEVTGFSPSFLNFGRHVPISGNYYGEVVSTDDIEISPGDRQAYAAELKCLSDVFQEVRRKLHISYKRNTKVYNLRKRDVSFEEGDRVWRRNKVLSDAEKKFSSKLAPKYVLCTVRKRVSRIVYALTNVDGTDAGEWHIKDLKPYFGSNSEISVG